MTLLDTATVLAKLREPQTDTERQAYKATLAGHMCVVYDPNKPKTNEDGDPDLDRVVVRAENVEHYIKKGFFAARAEAPVIVPPKPPLPFVAPTAPPAPPARPHPKKAVAPTAPPPGDTGTPPADPGAQA